MAKLSTKARNKISKAKFALPEQRAYPVPDKEHAKNAIARASQMYKAGKITPGEMRKVVAKARKVLGASPSEGKKPEEIVKEGRRVKKAKAVRERYGTRKVEGGKVKKASKAGRRKKKQVLAKVAKSLQKSD